MRDVGLDSCHPWAMTTIVTQWFHSIYVKQARYAPVQVFQVIIRHGVNSCRSRWVYFNSVKGYNHSQWLYHRSLQFLERVLNLAAAEDGIFAFLSLSKRFSSLSKLYLVYVEAFLVIVEGFLVFVDACLSSHIRVSIAASTLSKHALNAQQSAVNCLAAH